MKQYYYVEADGGVYTVQKNGIKTFPKTINEIPFEIEIETQFNINPDTKIYFCAPKEFIHEQNWPIKDALIAEDNLDEIVKKAIARTTPMLGSSAVIIENKKILLVHNIRGFSKNLWTLPGGIIRYSNTPEETAIRETKEETSLDVEIDNKVNQPVQYINAKCCQNTGYYFIGFACHCKKIKGTLQPKKGEIDQINYFDTNKLPKKISNFTKKTIQLMLKL